MFRRFLLNPRPYFTKLKYMIAGMYFGLFKRVFEADGCSFCIPMGQTTWQDRGYLALGQYEQPERELVRKAVQPHSTVLELGGCLGVLSCITNKLLDDPKRHLVVEANADLISSILQNRDRNKCQFYVEHCVISTRNTVDFYVSESVVCGSMLSHTGRKTRVAGRTCADLETRYGLEFDTLVMDIEGAEYELITGRAVEIAKFATILLENHPRIIGQEKTQEYESLLNTLGFTEEMRRGDVSLWRNVALHRPDTR